MTLQFDATDADLVMFLDEAGEQLKTLSDGLLRMENGGDPQLIQAVFRAAHTLKGSSATIGHTRMATLTHAMESVLDNIRNGVLAPTTVVIDTLLAGVDALNVLNEEVETREENAIGIDELIARLHEAASGKLDDVEADVQGHSTLTTADGGAAAALNTDEQATIAAALTQSGTQGFEVEVTIDPASTWPAVRAYQALMELAPLGTLVRSTPSEDELQSGEGGHTLMALIVSEREPAVLESAAASVSEVTAVIVRPMAPPATAAAETSAEKSAPAVRQMEGEDVLSAADERKADGGPVAGGSSKERRRADLGPEMRGTTIEEQLAGAGQKISTVSRMVKVDIARLDELMNLVGELVIDRGRMIQVQRELSERFGNEPALEHLTEVTQHLTRLSDDLQEQVMLSRLLPVESVFNRFPRMVRDLAKKSGKQVRFVMEGEQTGLDRSVIDEIGDPLLHLLRNAVDHGVEPKEDRLAAGKPEEATLLLAARHEENHIVIEVTDDGRGIDAQKMRESAARKGVITQEAAGRLSDEEAINLIFMPGFSSAEKVTDVSGRGVGMDIVRTNIEKINGAVHVYTKVGEGTTFSIKLPLTLAIIKALLVRVGEGIFTIPLAAVQETMRVRQETIHTVQQREFVLVRGQALPLVWLSDVFVRPGKRVERSKSEWCYIVAVRTGRTDLGFVVDSLIGEQEVVIKSIGKALGEIEGMAGATILGDGRVSMIVDVLKVVERLAVGAAAGRAA